jgi:NADPH2:quinone reductase
MKAVYIEQNGGVETLIYGERPKPEPAAGEVLVKIAVSGVNFIDTYHRTGLYKLPLPAILGSEAAGTVEQVGEGVTGFKPGDRVAYAPGLMAASVWMKSSRSSMPRPLRPVALTMPCVTV